MWQHQMQLCCVSFTLEVLHRRRGKRSFFSLCSVAHFLIFVKVIMSLSCLPLESNRTQEDLVIGEFNLPENALKLSLNLLWGSDEKTKPVN